MCITMIVYSVPHIRILSCGNRYYPCMLFRKLVFVFHKGGLFFHQGSHSWGWWLVFLLHHGEFSLSWGRWLVFFASPGWVFSFMTVVTGLFASQGWAFSFLRAVTGLFASPWWAFSFMRVVLASHEVGWSWPLRNVILLFHRDKSLPPWELS